jgi:hypothetical protein
VIHDMRLSLVSLAPLGALLLPSLAAATPRALPMSYTAETLPAGHLELEPSVDYTRVRARDHATGDPAWYGASALQLEIEYGLTDRLELGLYITSTLESAEFDDKPALLSGNGLKQRLRWRATEPGGPFDLALYGEVSENEREIELEAKVILQANLGHGLRAVTNLWAEREYYYEGRAEWVVNPTAALTWEATPAIHPGLEAWLRGEYPDGGVATRGFNLGPHLYVGPTLMVDLGKLWITTGVYLRATDVDHDPAPGEGFGRFWGRVILGISMN